MDYYAILEVARNATSIEIRQAYKRLAMLYHPDHHAGDKQAEEKFKDINEAYHILSDPLKKSRFDKNFILTSNDVEAELSEVKKKKQYAYRKAQESSYIIDKNYYRIQGLAFLVFLVMAGTVFGIIHTVNYFVGQKQLALWHENSLKLKKVNALFNEGAFEDSFMLMENLKGAQPLEFRFIVTHDSLVTELRNQANEKFKLQEFKDAVMYYTVLKNKEKPTRLETLERIATCQFYLGNFEESLTSLKHLHSQQPWDLELIYQIGILNFEKLNNHEEALFYFTKGKDQFKKNLTEVYGKAFALVMDPKDVPDVYYDIFVMRAKTNMALEDYLEALIDCKWATFLRSQNGEAFKLLAECRIKTKDFKEACKDLTKASLKGMDVSALQKKYCR